MPSGFTLRQSLGPLGANCLRGRIFQYTPPLGSVLLHSFAIILKLLCTHSRRKIQPTSWLLVSWLVDHQTRPLSWEAVKHKYPVYALVSAISYGNVQLIVISLLAINVSGWKLAEALTLCISANSVESCNSEIQSCLSDKKNEGIKSLLAKLLPWDIF